jgi:hypothetical protein
MAKIGKNGSLSLWLLHRRRREDRKPLIHYATFLVQNENILATSRDRAREERLHSTRCRRSPMTSELPVPVDSVEKLRVLNAVGAVGGLFRDFTRLFAAPAWARVGFARSSLGGHRATPRLRWARVAAFLARAVAKRIKLLGRRKRGI